MKNQKKLTILNYVLIFAVIGVVFYLNFCRLAINMDTDYIAELNYGRTVWNDKSIFPDNWVYANEYMFFRPALLFSVFYAITGRYIISYSIALSISFLLIIGAFIYFIKGSIKSKNSILFSILLLVSFCGTARSFAVVTYLYYGYYSFYLIVVLLTIGYFERVFLSKEKNKWMSLMIVVFAFLLGIAGIRMTFFLYLPILIMGLIFLFQIRLKKEQANWNDIGLCFLLFLFNIGGILVSRRVLSNSNIVSNITKNLSITDILSIPTKIWTNLVSALSMLIGNTAGCPAISLQTADMLAKGILVLFAVFIVIQYKKLFLDKPAFYYFGTYFFLILAITSFTSFGSGVAFYYFLLPVLFIYIIIGYLETVWHTKKSFLPVAMIYFVFFTNFFLYYSAEIKEAGTNTNTVQLVEWLQENKIDKITASFWTAGPIEAYSDGKIIISYLYSDSTRDINGYVYLNDRRNYSIHEKETIVLLTDKEEQGILQNSNSKLYTRNVEKVIDIGRYHIYKFAENPIGLFELPEIGMEQEYAPEIFIRLNTELISDGSVCSNGTEGYFITGPYIHVTEGIYTITFEYQILAYQQERNQVGFADVSIDSGKKQLKLAEIPSDCENGTIVLDQVSIENAEKVEFRMFAYEGSKIQVTKIRIRREE